MNYSLLENNTGGNNEGIIGILPFKKIYVDRIAKGKKKWEFRRNLFKYYKYIYAYVGIPISKIILEMELEYCIKDIPKNIWKICKKEAGISKKDFFEYYRNKKIAYAYRIKKYKKINKMLEEYNITIAPQLIFYIKEGEYGKGNKNIRS